MKLVYSGKKKDECRINAVEMRSQSSKCGVSLTDRCRNSDVRERCGLKEDVETREEKRTDTRSTLPRKRHAIKGLRRLLARSASVGVDSLRNGHTVDRLNHTDLSLSHHSSYRVREVTGSL
ncbi:hypothetical protein EVAR_50972_1 [Eumeta japonica]|uniref:Uncharacterized protein n=1 Tax=Eumeta variegata TaxID=151549 RepID=A0A4C1X9X1_EUMVA|nr:hypothetical protein EVAR_50972_1 [Eumeta japonica]